MRFTRGIIGPLGLAAFLGLWGCGKRGKTPPLLPEAEFVFQGTLKAMDVSTMDADDPKGLALVHVDAILQAPADLEAFQGQDITVRLKDPAAGKAGESRVYFVDVEALGESMSVREVHGLSGPEATKPQELKMRLEKEAGLRATNKLKERIAASERVVRAKVSAVKPAEEGAASEHDPQWQEATLEVSESFKGPAGEKSMTVVFPGSVDVMWYQVPKLKVGMEGVFLLRKAPQGAKPGEKLGLLDKADLHLQEAEAAILPLLRGK